MDRGRAIAYEMPSQDAHQGDRVTSEARPDLAPHLSDDELIDQIMEENSEIFRYLGR